MTDDEWWRSNDLEAMVSFVRGRASERKLRLFGVACCRQIEHLLTDGRSRQALAVAERLADRQVRQRELSAVRDAAWGAAYQANNDVKTAAWAAARTVETTRSRSNPWGYRDPTAWGMAYEAVDPALRRDVRLNQCDLFRDIFGNLIHAEKNDQTEFLAPSATVVKLAQAIYAERAFDQLPNLAVALEQAGCDDMQVLEHCREFRQHVRGCWVVDWLLGKE